jgi:hypothetical protein
MLYQGPDFSHAYICKVLGASLLPGLKNKIADANRGRQCSQCEMRIRRTDRLGLQLGFSHLWALQKRERKDSYSGELPEPHTGSHEEQITSRASCMYIIESEVQERKSARFFAAMTLSTKQEQTKKRKNSQTLQGPGDKSIRTFSSDEGSSFLIMSLSFILYW